jgi:hypothetical protein
MCNCNNIVAEILFGLVKFGLIFLMSVCMSLHAVLLRFLRATREYCEH